MTLIKSTIPRSCLIYVGPELRSEDLTSNDESLFSIQQNNKDNTDSNLTNQYYDKDERCGWNCRCCFRGSRECGSSCSVGNSPINRDNNLITYPIVKKVIHHNCEVIDSMGQIINA